MRNLYWASISDLFWKASSSGSAYAPFTEPDLGLERGHRLEVDRGAPQVSLHREPEFGEVGMKEPEDVDRVEDVGRLLHVDLDGGADRLGLGSQPAEVVDACPFVERQAELGQLDRHRAVELGLVDPLDRRQVLVGRRLSSFGIRDALPEEVEDPADPFAS